jgi:diadenosine tetraphosphatase ApaH/serine/threonine PP2A family protein phosphatase
VSDGVIRMAVVSDVHARPGLSATTAKSWVQSGEAEPGNNPLAGLRGLIESEELEAEVLLCPGDLCDKAQWDALGYVWEQLDDVVEALGAEALIATAGNHDIDSHSLHAPAPIASGLQRLHPPFPARVAETAESYWGSRISLVRGAGWQVLSLNSTLMRALDEAGGERDHGEISSETLAAVNEALNGRLEDVNVLMCHHHPLPSTHLNQEDSSQMDNGDRLVRLLDELGGPWFVVHGHKHEPDLDYLQGGGGSPVRLACGSLGAMLRGRHGTQVRNQFHVIEFPVELCEGIHLRLGGWVRSWTWRAMTGWEPALAGDGLPARAGFGHRVDGDSLASELVAGAQREGLATLERSALDVRVPKLEFMLPKDLKRLMDALESGGCRVQLDRHGNIDRLVMP